MSAKTEGNVSCCKICPTAMSFQVKPDNTQPMKAQGLRHSAESGNAISEKAQADVRGPSGLSWIGSCRQ